MQSSKLKHDPAEDVQWAINDVTRSDAYRQSPWTSALSLAAIYAVAGGLWIFLSGSILHILVRDPETAYAFEQAKGWLFIGVTALLLYLLLDRYFRQIKRSAYKYQMVVENAPVGIFIQVDGKVAYANRAAERCFGFEQGAKSISGRPVMELFHADFHDRVRQRIHQLGVERTAVPAAIEKCVRDDGSEFDGEFSALPIQYDNRHGALVFFHDVTERLQAEAALRDREQQLSLFVQHTPVAVALLDRNMRYLMVSQRWLSDFQLDENELNGKSHYEVFKNLPAHWKAIHKRCLEGAIESRDCEAFERSDGGVQWIRWEVRPWRTSQGDIGGLTIFSEDITDRVEAQAKLHISEERFRTLAETIREVFWMSSADGSKMLYVSPAYESIWGRTCQSLYDDPYSWSHAIHAEDRQRVVQKSSEPPPEEGTEIEYRIQRPDGKLRWIRNYTFPIRVDGTLDRIVGRAQDITENKELEAQLQHSQKMEAVGQLAGGVAHDFNNILAAIMLQADLIACDSNLPAECREGLNEIGVAAERGAGLTRQLLLFSRRQPLQLQILDLNCVVQGIVRMISRTIGADIQLRTELASEPLTISADAGMLDQVLLNLAVNARDAMPDGGTLLVSTAVYEVTEEMLQLLPEGRVGRFAVLNVSDTGVGIPYEIQSRIFEPFFTTKGPSEGTGLGLATVFGIAKQHQGWIKVYSEQGKGSTFRVFLPLSEAEGPLLTRDAGASGETQGSETILLVEDEKLVRSLVRMILERKGYRVREAANGVEALRVWEKHSHEISLLLTDLVMPEQMRGHQLAEKLRAQKSSLAIIYMSGYSATLAESEVELRPGYNFLQKPFSPSSLLNAIRQQIDSM